MGRIIGSIMLAAPVLYAVVLLVILAPMMALFVAVLVAWFGIGFYLATKDLQ